MARPAAFDLSQRRRRHGIGFVWNGAGVDIDFFFRRHRDVRCHRVRLLGGTAQFGVCSYCGLRSQDRFARCPVAWLDKTKITS